MMSTRTFRTCCRAVFLDKDGTLVWNLPFNVDPTRMQLMPGALAGCIALHRTGYRLVVVSNQAGVALGRFDESALQGVRRRLEFLLAEADVPLAGFYFCPHLPAAKVERYAIRCRCRKPQPGMLRRAARELGINLAQSWMVGDILDDVEAGRSAGCRTILLDNGNETQWSVSRCRQPDWIVTDLHQAAQCILSSHTDSSSDQPDVLTMR